MIVKTTTVTHDANLRLGQAVYNAVYKHLKAEGRKHSDNDVMNALYSMPDSKLRALLKEGA